MTGSGGSASARPAWTGADATASEAMMSIGEVLAQLRTDFPDTTISKLRFLEAEGLVEPSRTPAGYRKYAPADLARLRFVLAAQRDHYLPLRVIREQLAAIDRGDAPALARPALVAVPPERADVAPAGGTTARDEPRLSRTDLLLRAGVGEDVLTDLERHGLLAAGPAGWFPAAAVEVLAAAGALAEFGVQGRHLRAYRASADREVGLFTQLAAPLARGSGPSARDRADETVRELSSLTQRLHAALVRIGLTQTLGR